MIKSYQQVGRH